jgi:hypothetical protein
LKKKSDSGTHNMTWAYRVMRRKVGNGYGYGIYEFYGDIAHDGPGWTKDALGPFGETLGELRRDYRLMDEAFDLPILDHETGKEIRKTKEKKNG